MKPMIGRVLPSLCLVAALYPNSVALAQTTPTSTTPATAAAPDIVVTSEVHTNGISATTAARLSATAPKFVPPASTETGTRATETRVSDQPKNGIVRLPDYIINEPKAPAFKEREPLTRNGRLEQGYKLNPGLRLGPPSLLNDGVALTMLEENFRLERKAEMEDLTNLITSPSARAKAQDETHQTFRRVDFRRSSAPEPSQPRSR
ncbi:MAG: hypothetical protein H7343_21645 [Undibacterium sp.]|nr:hypothetical protein [Opitutaceae bacterium]